MTSKAELAEWIDTARAVDSDLKAPPNVIRALIAQSVIDNWPRYEIEHDIEGNPVMLKFGSPSAANKALEMLAKDAGMLDDRVDVSGRIDITINGVDMGDLQ